MLVGVGVEEGVAVAVSIGVSVWERVGVLVGVLAAGAAQADKSITGNIKMAKLFILPPGNIIVRIGRGEHL